MLNRIMKDESGVLTFEWILLITLLVIGIVGGIAVMRDALIIEAAETAGAIVALDQSYIIADPIEASITYATATAETTGSINTVVVATAIDQLSDAEGSKFNDNKGVVEVDADTANLDEVTESAVKK